jgi:preprotein translocase subunit SecF
MIGIIIGTYSSIFIASMLMYDTIRKKGYEPEEAKVVAKA